MDSLDEALLGHGGVFALTFAGVHLIFVGSGNYRTILQFPALGNGEILTSVVIAKEKNVPGTHGNDEICKWLFFNDPAIMEAHFPAANNDGNYLSLRGPIGNVFYRLIHGNAEFRIEVGMVTGQVGLDGFHSSHNDSIAFLNWNGRGPGKVGREAALSMNRVGSGGIQLRGVRPFVIKESAAFLPDSIFFAC